MGGSLVLLRIGVALLTVSLGGTCLAQRFEGVEIKSEQVADGLHMLQGAGGNLGVSIGDDGVFVVDSQFSELNAKILARIAELGGGTPRFLVNTHWHGDHVGGNEPMAAEGATVLAHHHVRERMSAGDEPAAEAARPVITYGDGVTFHLNGETIRAEHYHHAHTDGDTILWFEEADVVHMGDIFFNGIYPFLDHDSGGSIQGTIRAVNDVLTRIGAETRIIPGHGPLADREALTAYRDMLEGVHAAVRAEVDAGKTLEQTIAADPLAAWNEAWGQSFIKPERMVRLVYLSITAPPGK